MRFKRNQRFGISGVLCLMLGFCLSNSVRGSTDAKEFPFNFGEIKGDVPSLDGLAIPRKPVIDIGMHLKNIHRSINTKVPVTRGASQDLYKKIVRSVVHIYHQGGTGSGVVVDARGLIITNHHVVSGHKSVAVNFRTQSRGQIRDKRVYIADVIRVKSEWDLALLRMRDVPENLTDMALGHLRDAEIGMEVHAIGHPRNMLWTYTKGVISQIRPGFDWGDHRADIIQTQTPINPGNSGGPLFTDAGRLIGINSFSKAKSEALHFAISVNHVRQLLDNDYSRKQTKSVLPTSIRLTAARSHDSNSNGVKDFFCFDTDSNGKIDMCAVDDDENGIEEYWLLDLNENGTKDGMIAKSKSGSGLIWSFDYDEDGTLDLQGLDFDSDGVVDQYYPITK